MKFVLVSLLMLLSSITHAADYSAENPEYVKQYYTNPGGFFLILSRTACGPCYVLAKRFEKAEMPYAIVEVDAQPHTAAMFPVPAVTPTVYWMLPKQVVKGAVHREWRRLTIWMTDP